MCRFSKALDHLMDGGLGISRSDWNGAGLIVRMHTPNYGVEPHLIIYNSNTGKSHTWVPSSADLLADTWELQGDIPNVKEEVILDLNYEKTFDTCDFNDVFLVSATFRGVKYAARSSEDMDTAINELIEVIQKEQDVYVKHCNRPGK